MRVDTWTMPIVRGDRFVLCSDGLVDEVVDDDIQRRARSSTDDPRRAAEALVDAANERGGRDNITVVVVDVLEGDDPPDPTEELDVIPAWATRRSAGARSSTSTTRTSSSPCMIATVAAGAPPTTTSRSARRPASATGSFASSRSCGIAAVLVLGFAILAAWARDGYFVAFDDDGTVVIYKGRPDSVLWFDPTVEAVTPYSPATSSTTSRSRSSRTASASSRSANAAIFVAGPARDDHDHDDHDHHDDHDDHDRRPPRPPLRATTTSRDRLSMATTIVSPALPGSSSRRITELTLIVMAAAITGVAYTLASLGANAVIPARLVPFLALVLGSVGAAHIAVRLLARGADGTLLPLAALLHGIGYVMITRLDDNASPACRHVERHRHRGLHRHVARSSSGRPTWRAYKWTLFTSAPCSCCCRWCPASANHRRRPDLGRTSGRSTSSPASSPSSAFAIFFAGYLAERRELIAAGTWKIGPIRLPEPRYILPILVAWAFAVVVMVGEKDLGSSLLFFTLFVVMMWVATERRRYLVHRRRDVRRRRVRRVADVRPRADPRRHLARPVARSTTARATRSSRRCTASPTVAWPARASAAAAPTRSPRRRTTSSSPPSARSSA